MLNIRKQTLVVPLLQLIVYGVKTVIESCYWDLPRYNLVIILSRVTLVTLYRKYYTTKHLTVSIMMCSDLGHINCIVIAMNSRYPSCELHVMCMYVLCHFRA